MDNQQLRKRLTSRRACNEAMTWLGERDSNQMWAECERPDWMLWYASAHVSRQQLVLAACECARTALIYVPDGEDIPRLAIETAERWARGENGVTLEMVSTAARAAYAAAYAARAANAAAYAADAAYAAAYAARAANAAAYAADAAAYAADAANAVADAARTEMCVLIRNRWPVVPVRLEADNG